jgi:magnesium transporter
LFFVITIFVHRGGKTEQVTAIDRAWLNPDAGVTFWVDLQAPTVPESLILGDTMAFHPLSVEDAMSVLQYPKVEAYDGYLYVVLHAIDFTAGETGFKTHDIDFFLGARYLVTVHDGRSSAITELHDHCPRNPRILADGPVALFHRIVDAMVDSYRPEVEKLEDRLDKLENEVFDNPTPALARQILAQKRDVSSLRRVTTPQRDVIARLARREFAEITPEMAFSFRDVYDHLVRIADDALIFQDRITGILDAHLSNVSNRLNQVMKVLTVVATIFMPMTVLTGMYGMNVDLPHFPGGAAAQFWWIAGIMTLIVVVMLAWFHRKGWI